MVPLSTIFRDDRGSVILESAFGVALILTVALPFASLVSYATSSASDLSSVQGAVRAAALSERTSAADPAIDFTCGATADTATGTCAAVLARATYVAAFKDTVVALPFGLALHTNARGVARVE